jgi:REP element-mobilizing transposase RayT
MAAKKINLWPDHIHTLHKLIESDKGKHNTADILGNYLKKSE